MAYAQWVSITVQAKGKGFTATLKNVAHNWGKFYDCKNKDNEVAISVHEGAKIPAETSRQICACGRSDASAGTEGQFDIYDDKTHVGTYYWDCPWGSKTNISRWTPNDAVQDFYITECKGGNLDSGALGDITIRCVKL